MLCHANYRMLSLPDCYILYNTNKTYNEKKHGLCSYGPGNSIGYSKCMPPRNTYHRWWNRKRWGWNTTTRIQL